MGSSRRRIVALLLAAGLVAGCGGGPTPSPSAGTPSVEPTRAIVAMAAGTDFTCVLLRSGSITCWGSDEYGQLGDSLPTPGSSGVSVAAMRDVVALSARGRRTCAVRTDGSVWCWGGLLDVRGRPVPAALWKVEGIASAVAVAPTVQSPCVLLSNRSVWCWFEYSNGDRAELAEKLPASDGTVALVAGTPHTCALLASGKVKCWGFNGVQGYLGGGGGSEFDEVAAVAVAGIDDAKAIGTGPLHTCVVVGDGRVKCWGSNDFGRLGDGTWTDSATPVTVMGVSGAIAVAGGDGHTCAILAGGTVTCWGRNDYGQLGDGTLTSWSGAVRVSGIDDAIALAAGDFHTCALLARGGLRCWGRNESGQLGNRSAGYSATPVPVEGLG
jgi:alpha-tubulin suppressor-like RCC1 family protein